MRAEPAILHRAWRAVRWRRVAAMLLAALLAGLASDWLRSDGRLVFPRPLPEFRVVPARP